MNADMSTLQQSYHEHIDTTSRAMRDFETAYLRARTAGDLLVARDEFDAAMNAARGRWQQALETAKKAKGDA